MKSINALQRCTMSPLRMSAILGGCSREHSTKNGVITIKVTRCDVDDCPAKKDPSILLPNGQNGKTTVEAPSSKKRRSIKA